MFLFCFPQALRRLRSAGRGARPQQLVTQGAGGAPGLKQGCPQPSVTGEPRAYVGAELRDGDVPPPAAEEPGRSLSPLTVVRHEAHVFTKVFGNTAEKQTAFAFFSLPFFFPFLPRLKVPWCFTLPHNTPTAPLPASPLKPQLSNYHRCSQGAGSQRGPREIPPLACQLGLARMCYIGEIPCASYRSKSARRAVHSVCVCIYPCVHVQKDII